MDFTLLVRHFSDQFSDETHYGPALNRILTKQGGESIYKTIARVAEIILIDDGEHAVS